MIPVQAISFLGLLTFVGIAYGLSENRKIIAWRTVITGIALQFIFAFLILKTDTGHHFFKWLGDIFNLLLVYTQEGSEFVFGNLAKPSGSWGFLFFTMVLPTIIVISSLMSVLYHLGIMQKIVKGMAYAMMKVMKISGAESLAAAANIFLGQTEAPLVIKPYVDKMTPSEIMCLMTGGMATIAGGVLVAYIGFGIDASHLLAASFMAAPASIVFSKLMVPETGIPVTMNQCDLDSEKTASNVIDAAATGASEGLKLAVNVGAMVLSFIALIALFNGLLSWFFNLFGLENITFELIMGYINAPFAWLLGIPWEDCLKVGSVLGKRIVLNEFVAYVDLAQLKSSLSDRSMMLTTYALCGFANLSSIAIQIGGIGTMSPIQRKTIIKYGFKSLIAGTLACYMTAAIAGLMI